jgi:hypothetical protein
MNRAPLSAGVSIKPVLKIGILHVAAHEPRHKRKGSYCGLIKGNGVPDGVPRGLGLIRYRNSARGSNLSVAPNFYQIGQTEPNV